MMITSSERSRANRALSDSLNDNDEDNDEDEDEDEVVGLFPPTPTALELAGT